MYLRSERPSLTLVNPSECVAAAAGKEASALGLETVIIEGRNGDSEEYRHSLRSLIPSPLKLVVALESGGRGWEASLQTADLVLIDVDSEMGLLTAPVSPGQIVARIKIDAPNLETLEAKAAAALAKGITKVVFMPPDGVDLTGVGGTSGPWHMVSFAELAVNARLLSTRQSVEVYLRPGILPTKLLRDHPCNGYVCCGEHCHAGHGSRPRRLVVEASGEVFPFTSRLGNRASMGFFPERSLADMLNRLYEPPLSEVLETCRRLYLELAVDCPHAVFPWEDALVELFRNDNGQH